jgi:hypothetical protein
LVRRDPGDAAEDAQEVEGAEPGGVRQVGEREGLAARGFDSVHGVVDAADVARVARDVGGGRAGCVRDQRLGNEVADLVEIAAVVVAATVPRSRILRPMGELGRGLSRLIAAGAIVLGLASCGGAGGKSRTEREAPQIVETTGVAAPAPSAAAGAATEPEPEPEPALGPIPVTAADPTEGDPSAAVTVVVFWDHESEKSVDMATTLLALQMGYQPEELRIAFKHRASPRGIRSAHEEAAAVFRVGGMPAFTTYLRAIAYPGSLAKRRERGLAKARGLVRSGPSFSPTPEDTRKVNADVALATKLGIGAPPVVFINGRRVDGEVPADGLESLILDELALANAAHPDGKRPPDWYVRRSTEAFAESAAAARPAPGAEDKAQQVVYGAKHLVVQWAGAKRSKQTRTKAEAKQRAAQALAELKRGVAFEDVVTRYSDEPGAQTTGGNIGRFARRSMDPAFGDAVAALAVGAMSGIVESQFGFHIIVRTE